MEYRVPTMAEVGAVPWNGLTVASTFSGCGGSSLGYRMAGYRVLWASEFVDAARASYVASASGAAVVDGRGLRLVTAEDVFAATGMAKGELDLLDGSPPCASFSLSGNRAKDWGKAKRYSDTTQRTDDLFLEFARLLRGLQPRCFVAENVAGLVTGVAKGHFLEILAALKGCGYRVECRVVDAQWLGVPQARRRTIFVGVRNDIDRAPSFPTPSSSRFTIADALRSVTGPVEPETAIARFAIGREYDRMRPGSSSDKYFNLVRPRADRPCPTICATAGSPGAAGIVHHTEKRKFTIQELKAICSFPADFVLTGTYAQQWERLGRAVPPVMMAAIAAKLRDDVLCQ